MSKNTKDFVKDRKSLEDLFDFTNLDGKHELFSNKNKRVIRKNKIETPKSIRIVEFTCLRSKTHTFKYGGNIKIKLNYFPESQTKLLNLKKSKNV